MSQDRAEKINPYQDDTRAKTEQVRDMFDNIAPDYDFMNKAMSFGLHRLWLSNAVGIVKKSSPKKILDVATGTADVAIKLARKIPSSHVTGIDLSQGMIDVGKRKIQKAGLSDKIDLRQADCLALPFEDNSFDCVTVAYGVRNFERLLEGYKEMLRVLKPGGRIVVIELSTPANIVFKPFYKIYTSLIIPLIGRVVSKDVRAYSYLPESIEAVAQRSAMSAMMLDAGFTHPAYFPQTFGVCMIYTAEKKL